MPEQFFFGQVIAVGTVQIAQRANRLDHRPEAVLASGA